MQIPKLDDRESEMLAGGLGADKQRAMNLLVDYAKVVGAKKFVPIASAHIDSCLYHGQSSIDFIDRFVSLKARVSVPTTLNVGAVDTKSPELNVGDEARIASQRKLTEKYTRIGCVPTLTCAPYQRQQRPKFGEHVAWAESNAIVFANSVLGARTERYGDFVDVCAAITGRVPLTGLHCDQNRLASVVVEVAGIQKAKLGRDIYFGCVGYCLGKHIGSAISVIIGVPSDANENELKLLGAAAATSGSVALFHIAGITPEAPTLEQVLRSSDSKNKNLNITADDLRAAAKMLCPVKPGEIVSAICLGTPHFSVSEFQHLTALVKGKRAVVEVYISTSREIAAQIKAQNWYQNLVDFGACIVVDTCTYLAPVVRDCRGVILTNSVKWAHYGPGNLKRRAGLMSIEDCIRSAESGFVCD